MKKLVNIEPNRSLKVFLAIIPFVIMLLIYWSASNERLAANPYDKLLPSFSQISAAIDRLAFTEDKRSGEYLFWVDSAASLYRIGLGVAISATMGLILGVLSGLLPTFRAGFSPLITIISLIPPMAVLPILFITFGLGELAKVMLIIIGTAPVIIRDIQNQVRQLPTEIMVKAQTLGASTWLLATRVVLPQIMPRLITAVRLSLGTAWLFLIAAEAIAAQEGLGYRIFLVRRYMSMDVILPYVMWITALAFAMDFSLRKLSELCFPWYHQQEAAK
ncbi:nitrate/sulfonate/bicarbonate ABC transporter permease [Catenovulum agarivorans DS-2]|uniref:Nitrate/sulfonate/bicarbonate ABC transporter permease n=1 Tax=Catenovulum agarivorans DS-2 TaxID=1328313 RepID=W7QJC6_9ALTE|nr:ABC transporter permease subunit [Catenovulum agarivorans]EWH09052.1 nitrate/sulfonate/bicarbonate ABC transporter permease [Catenovulum agarivorans DS-2]